MRRITSALYLDFDNLLGRLAAADQPAAKELATNPGALVESLAALDRDVRRDVLVRRAYMNSAGTVPHPDATTPGSRKQLSSFRGALTGAGFEVVDCPTLTKTKKNAADIRMVIDILDATSGPVRYDEIIVASDDSDFTPLLIKLRSLDYRTTIVGTGSIAAAYGAAADRRIGEDELIQLLAPRVTPLGPQRVVPAPPERVAARTLQDLLAASAEPVFLGAAGKEMRKEVREQTGSEVGSGWFGHRTLKKFIEVRMTNLKVDGLTVWDPARHPEPIAAA